MHSSQIVLAIAVVLCAMSLFATQALQNAEREHQQRIQERENGALHFRLPDNAYTVFDSVVIVESGDVAAIPQELAKEQAAWLIRNPDGTMSNIACGDSFKKLKRVHTCSAGIEISWKAREKAFQITQRDGSSWNDEGLLMKKAIIVPLGGLLVLFLLHMRSIATVKYCSMISIGGILAGSLGSLLPGIFPALVYWGFGYIVFYACINLAWENDSIPIYKNYFACFFVALGCYYATLVGSIEWLMTLVQLAGIVIGIVIIFLTCALWQRWTKRKKALPRD